MKCLYWGVNIMEEEKASHKFKLYMSAFNTVLILIGIVCLIYSGVLIVENYF